ncbi:MAG: Sensor protein ZraS [Smithella sp. PtaU1.Bin162]|nr:MAG: Sensor protein ZraS [Smithella sp. PtaU1.Bin162]
MKTRTGKKFRFDISIWMVISAVAVLAVISTVMILTHFQKQQDQAVERLLEKGSTLILSFEAGLRSQTGKSSDIFSIQKLLMETAQQPDIDYIVITDNKGNIIADSDPSMVGRQYGLDLDIANIAASRDKKWRQAANPEGAGTFEVYRGFFPQAGYNEKQTAEQNSGNMIIYVGFNMDEIEKAGKEDTRNTIIIALILLLIGSSAIVSLFLAQAYRIARTSLSRITIFSEALVKNMPIGLVALDESGNIVTCNETAGRILNIDCNDAIGKQAATALPEALQKIFADLSQQDGPVEKDLQFIPGQDKNKTLEIVAAGLADSGISTGKMMLLRDVTALRQLEKEVAKSRHLNSIASLAAGVAHEIRNPLSSIKGFAVYFRERFSEKEEDQTIADTMIAEVERLNRVISQLIEFARPLELKREKIHLPDLFQHPLTLIAPDLKKNNINIIMNTAPDMPLVDVDPDKVKQVLLNVFLNAAAAMKNGGTLEISLMTDKNIITVAVSDTGTGIEKKDLPRIYDPYFTSKPTGTGLGLAVVQKIMEAHGGTINVESTAGQGTTVSLHFPLNL